MSITSFIIIPQNYHRVKSAFKTMELAGDLGGEYLAKGDSIKLIDAFGKAAAVTFPKATKAVKDVSAAFSSGTSAAGKFKAVLSGLWGVIAAHPFLAIAAAVGVAISVVDAFTVSAAEAKENLNELKDEYSENETELSSVNSELDETKKRIDELQAKGTLTFTEREELENLQNQNTELERQKSLLEAIQNIKRSEINSAFVQTMRKDVDNTFEYQGWGGEGPEFYSDRDRIQNAIKDYQYYTEAIAKLDEEYANNLTDSDYQAKRAKLDKWRQESMSYLVQKNEDFAEASNGISYIPEPSTEDEKNVNLWLDYINDFQDRMNILLGGDGAKSHAFTRVATTTFSDVTADLQELGKQGEVTGEMLQNAKYETFVNKMIELGVISGNDTESLQLLADAFNGLGISTDSAASGVSNVENEVSRLKESSDNTVEAINSITAVQKALASQEAGKSISLSEFTSDDLKEYSSALEYVNGVYQLNAEKVNEIIEAKTNELVAVNDTNKAYAQSEYLKNAAQIEQLRDQLDELGAGEETLGDEIEKNIGSLLEENSALKSICSQYDLMSASIREATSAYQHWINSQNASQTGDMFDGALSALQHISDTLNNTESDLYGRVGRSDYQAAVDFIVPDSVDKEDADAVNSYIASISDMFTFDENGNQTGLNIANFCQKAVDAGLMVLNEAGTAYEIAGGKTMEDFANGLNLALPLVQAMFGELEEFGAKFDWADEANKTFGDLAVSATEAAEALRAMEGNEDLKIDIDVTDIADKADQLAALDGTITEMQGLKAKIDVDTSEVEYANEIIKYCVAQKNLLEYQTILAVDSSKVTGDLSTAIELMQQFASLQGQLAEAQALNLDISSIEADIADVTGKIQSIDAGILADLKIDPASTDTIAASIQALTPEILIDAKVNPDAINGYTPDDKTATVIYDKDSTIPDEYEPDDKTATVTYSKISTSVDNYNPPNLTRYVTYYKQEGGDVSVNGTAHVEGTANASGTVRASGDWGTAPGGPTLVGELGREIVVDPHTGKWYTVGDRGAEFVNIPTGAIIFNHEQSDSLLEKGYVTGRGRAYASGTAMVSGYIPVTGMWGGGSSGSGNYGGSGNYYSDQNNQTSEDIAEDAKNAFEEAYKYHQHLLEMEQEDLEHYLRWLQEAYQDAYRNGEIELDDYYKYEEEVYEGRKELFQDYLNDLEFKIAGLKRLDGTEGQIINLYLGMIKDIKTEIAQARARGLDENDEYIQELIEQLRDYEDEIAEIREDVTDDAKGAVDDLIKYRIKMLKQDLENERDALEDKKDALKDFYDEQKNLLQQAYDDEKTLEERNEKRKTKTDIEAELDQLKFDDSAWAQKRKLELQEELSVAQKELDDFEKEQALNNAQNLLDATYEKQAAQIDAEIEAIEAKLNDPEALYNQALRDIQNNTQALYLEMVEYNAKYGDGNAETVKTMWDEAKASLDDFLDTFGRAYKDIILVASPGSSSSDGYASGTRNATPGVKKVDEKGSEWLFTSGDGTKYRVFSGGEMVLNAEATKFLYDFAMDRGAALSNMFTSLLNAANLTSIGKQFQPIQLSTGDIIIQGNADQKTVSEIRRAQREGIDYILKQFTRLNK